MGNKEDERKMREEISGLADHISEVLRRHINEIADNYNVDYETVASIYDEFAGTEQS